MAIRSTFNLVNDFIMMNVSATHGAGGLSPHTVFTVPTIPETTLTFEPAFDAPPVDVIQCCLKPLVSALGTVGNVLSLATLCVLFKHHAMHVMLVALAVADLGQLLVSQTDTVVCILQRFDSLAARNLTVGYYAQALWVKVVFSRIINVVTSCIAVQRCVVVYFPLKSRLLVTRKSIYVMATLAYIMTTGAHVLLFLRNDVMWMTTELQFSGQKINVTVAQLYETSFSVRNRHWLNFYKDFFLVVAFRICPMLTVSSCSILILFRVRRQQQWRQQVAGDQTSGKVRVPQARESRLTVTLLWVCTVFIVCSLPAVAAFFGRLLEPHFDYYGIYADTFATVMDVTNFLEVLNASVNFLIYMTTGRQFLLTLKNLLCNRCVVVNVDELSKEDQTTDTRLG